MPIMGCCIAWKHYYHSYSPTHILPVPVAMCQQHTTLHPTAGLLLKQSRVGPGHFRDGRPDGAGSGVGWPVGGTISSGPQKIFLCPRAVIDKIALCRVQTFRWDVKWVSWLSVVTKVPMALTVRVGVLTPVSWLNSQSGPHTIMVT
jgi:hypothetical protein